MSITQGILAASLLAVCIVFVAWGEEWTDPDTGYTWTYHVLEDNTVEIGGGNMDFALSPYAVNEVGQIAIPATISGKNVSRIGTCAFNGFGALTGVTIPGEVKSIGWGAFAGCWQLQHISIPNSVTNIEESAFAGCGLQSFSFPSRVSGIASYTLSGCSQLRNVTIPNSVTRIGEYALYECYNLECLTIPNSVMLIGNNAFTRCSNLKSVTIPGSVATIGESAFAECRNLESLTLSDGIERIEPYAFYSCPSLTKIILPTSLSSLGECAFAMAQEGDTGLGEYGNLTSVIIMNCAMEIDRSYYGRYGYWGYWLGPFSYCTSVKNVTMPRSIESLHLSDFYPDSYASITNVVVLDGTTRISDEAFKGCAGLQSVTLPPSLMQVGSRAFDGCTSLREVIYEGSAPEVGENIYQGTTNSLVTYVRAGSIGWAGGISTELPELWNGRAIAYIGGIPGSGTAYGGGAQTVVTNRVSVTSTNVVVHYVLNSVVPDIAVPVGGDAGFVTVVTEIKGGTVAIPESWATNYPSFTAKFGTDFTAALTKPTGKRDSQGNTLQVWHDYVAGTDPTNEDDVFKASIIMVDGEPVVGYTPILPENERGKRKYTIYGKARLQDELWQIVDGNARDFNFFKVTVEMR